MPARERRVRPSGWRMLPALALVAATAVMPAAAQRRASAARPQANGQLPAAPDMTQPPAVGAVRPYEPPESHDDQLPNGLRIVVVEDHRFPLVSARLSLSAGDIRLTPAQAGLDQAEADLLTEGTATRSALQIADDTDAMGGDLSAAAGPDFLTVSASALSENVAAMFALMADVVLHPSFPENEVALRRANMLQELNADRADAGFLADVEFSRLLFGAYPYAIVAPTEASIAAIDRPALLEFHRRYFLPNNQAVMVIVGDINPSVGHNLAQQYFGDWAIGNPAPPPPPAVVPPPARRIVLIDRPGSPQSTIELGNLGVTRLSPDYFAFRVANEVLGGSFNSRLVADVREQKGLAYDIGSRNNAMAALGAWEIDTQVKTASTADALAAIFAEMDRMHAAPIAADELRQARNYLAGNFVLSLSTVASVADQFLGQSVYGVPPDYLATWVNRIQAVTADAADRAADEYIHPDRCIVVIVGDVRQIEAPLAKLSNGPMTIYDEKGNVIGAYPH